MPFFFSIWRRTEQIKMDALLLFVPILFPHQMDVLPTRFIQFILWCMTIINSQEAIIKFKYIDILWDFLYVAIAFIKKIKKKRSKSKCRLKKKNIQSNNSIIQFNYDLLFYSKTIIFLFISLWQSYYSCAVRKISIYLL